MALAQMHQTLLALVGELTLTLRVQPFGGVELSGDYDILSNLNFKLKLHL